MRWGVPDGTRNPAGGGMVHDDDLITAALCSLLDRMEWRVATAPVIVRPLHDPLEEMDRRF